MIKVNPYKTTPITVSNENYKELFFGMDIEINKIIEKLKKVDTGGSFNIFVHGNKSSGKTSYINMITYAISSEKIVELGEIRNELSYEIIKPKFHYSMNMDDVLKVILYKVRKQGKQRSLPINLKVAINIKVLKIEGEKKNLLNNIIREELTKAVKKFIDKYSYYSYGTGIVIVIEDIGEIVDELELATEIKLFLEDISEIRDNVILILSGSTSSYYKFISTYPCLQNNFIDVELKKYNDKMIEKYLKRSEQYNKSFEEEAKIKIINYCDGNLDFMAKLCKEAFEKSGESELITLDIIDSVLHLMKKKYTGIFRHNKQLIDSNHINILKVLAETINGILMRELVEKMREFIENDVEQVVEICLKKLEHYNLIFRIDSTIYLKNKLYYEILKEEIF